MVRAKDPIDGFGQAHVMKFQLMGGWLIAHLLIWPFLAVSDTQDSPQVISSEMGRELRELTLLSPPEHLGIGSGEDCERVYGVLVEWPVDEFTATIVALCDGNASLYTTSTFGIIGGFAHEPVRVAAIRLVKAAEDYYSDSHPTKEYPYPETNRVKLYLLTFQGVRVIDADLTALESRKSRYSGLFGLGQNVLTELRRITEKKK